MSQLPWLSLTLSPSSTGARCVRSTLVALLSVDELNERIALLRSEIERLETVLDGKKASRNVADQFFKR